MKLANVGRRLRQIREYAAMGQSARECGVLAVMGVARGHPFSSPDLISSVGRRFFPELIVRPSLLAGLRLAIDPADVGHMVIFDEIVRDNNYDLGLVPFVPDQIFDCGGHIGMFSVLVSSRYPSTPVTVFEPAPRNVAWIRRQLELNQLNVEVVQAAVSIREGESTFEEGCSCGGHLVEDEAEPDAGGEAPRRYAVKILDFPAILRSRRPQRLLLKLDVEGEESKIIPALFEVLPPSSAVFFETHHGEAGWESAARRFRGHGFTVERRRTLKFFVDGFALRS